MRNLKKFGQVRNKYSQSNVHGTSHCLLAFLLHSHVKRVTSFLTWNNSHFLWKNENHIVLIVVCALLFIPFRSTMQQAFRNAKWPHTCKPTYCFFQLGQEPRTQLRQATFPPRWSSSGSLVLAAQQPSPVVSGLLWSPHPGSEVCYTRTTGCPSMGDSVLFDI